LIDLAILDASPFSIIVAPLTTVALNCLQIRRRRLSARCLAGRLPPPTPSKLELFGPPVLWFNGDWFE
jgi:hypothetical protein